MTCQFCGSDEGDDNSYMLRRDLWAKVIGKPYHYGSGWACLECVARRLYPYQLRNEDFTDGPGNDDEEPNRLNPRVMEVAGDGKYAYEVNYWIVFPDEGGDTVQVSTEYCTGDTNMDDVLEQEEKFIGWLWPYCEAHNLKPFLDGEEQELC